jgi:hypothetical protein
MRKKYVVRLSADERVACHLVITKQTGSSLKVRRAQILLKADADGPKWTDARIVEAFGCRRQTVEKLRERLVTEGFEAVLHGNHPQTPRAKVLDGAAEAKVIALRLGPPPKGYSNWSLRLLADRVVALEIVESISYETVRRALKKTASRRRRSNTG